MDQHPIPQNVTAYQFRLVGDMTLKQFSELAGGIFLAFLLSKTTLIPFFIKWPLAGLFAFGGIALAFLPIEERPLDQWLINFVKAIYSPTQYLWRKQNQVPNFFASKLGGTAQSTTLIIKPKDKKQLKSFTQTLSARAAVRQLADSGDARQQPPSPLDEQEKKTLDYIKSLFGPTTTVSIQPASSYKPAGLKQRKLKPKKEIIKEEIIFKQEFAKKAALKHQVLEARRLPPTPSVKPKVEPAQPLAPPFQITSLYPPKPPKKPKPRKKRVGPQFANDLPMPIPPDFPNLLVGMVVGPNDKLVPNAILEIRNSQNYPVRALKTNKLGQFFIATSLPNDNYEIEIDHPDYQFDIIKIQAVGKIVPPLKIKAVKEIKTLKTEQTDVKN